MAPKAPDDWLQEFVDDIVDAWGRLTKNAAVMENPAASDIGDEGEAFIEGKLTSQGYFTGRSPRSRSPADVWGAATTRDGVLHLALVQVKTSADGKPADLSDAETAALAAFVEYAFGRFKKSRAIPASFRRSPLAASCGYAGVRLGKRARVSSSYYVSGLIDEAINQRAADKFLRGFHEGL